MSPDKKNMRKNNSKRAPGKDGIESSKPTREYDITFTPEEFEDLKGYTYGMVDTFIKGIDGVAGKILEARGVTDIMKGANMVNSIRNVCKSMMRNSRRL